jgi:signal transduction histidine kinase
VFLEQTEFNELRDKQAILKSNFMLVEELIELMFSEIVKMKQKETQIVSQSFKEAFTLLENVGFGQSMTENLINDLMDLGKLQNGVFKFEEEFFSLPKVILQAFEILKSTALQKNIELSASIRDYKTLDYFHNLIGDSRRYL